MSAQGARAGGGLAGLRIVVTRERIRAAKFTGLLVAMGAEVIEFPMIEIAPPDSYMALDGALGRLDTFDWIIFTSANGVDAVANRMRLRGIDTAALGGKRIAAIGPATARRVRSLGLEVAAMPAEYRAEAIASELGVQAIAGARFLIPRAQVARAALPEILRERGAAEVLVAPAYRTIAPVSSDGAAMRARLAAGEIDLVTFTSSSTVENFVAIVGRIPSPARAAVIGPITAATARRHGFDVVVSPADYTVPALAAAIGRYFAGQARDRPD